MNKIFLFNININNFSKKATFLSGQCFRWEFENDIWRGIYKSNIIEITKENDVFVYSNNNKMSSQEIDYIKKEIFSYLSLDDDYDKIIEKISKLDVPFKDEIEKSLKYSYGLRILKQEPFETLISYIISANNNIPRIKNIIKKMSEKYGEKLVIGSDSYYSFPTFNKLIDVKSPEEFRKLGMGFRDKRIFLALRQIEEDSELSKIFFQRNYHTRYSTKKLKEKLLTISGVGEKVADCILLFAFDRKEVFPVDVWVRRIMNELVFKLKDEKMLKKEKIHEYVNSNLGEEAGILQEYLFYYWRTK